MGHNCSSADWTKGLAKRKPLEPCVLKDRGPVLGARKGLGRAMSAMALAFTAPGSAAYAKVTQWKSAASGSVPKTPSAHSGRGQSVMAISMATLTFVGKMQKRPAPSGTNMLSETAETPESPSKSNNTYAYNLVKLCLVITLVPFLFCLGNFSYDRSLSDFDLEYGPHLSHPALRTTSTIQAIMVFAALFWREKNRSDPIDRLFSWLFVPEAVTHILLHFFSHHLPFANFAFAYAFSAGIALPGFLSLLCYVPKEKKLPWAYLVLYVATQIPIVAGLTNMVGPAKMRLNYANINTACITSPFFYGILKRWNDVPKSPVILATLTISYQVAMGIMGPITGASDLKLYDPSCIFQHGVVDIGFGIAYAVSIICGVFKPGVPRPAWDRADQVPSG